MTESKSTSSNLPIYKANLILLSEKVAEEDGVESEKHAKSAGSIYLRYHPELRKIKIRLKLTDFLTGQSGLKSVILTFKELTIYRQQTEPPNNLTTVSIKYMINQPEKDFDKSIELRNVYSLDDSNCDLIDLKAAVVHLYTNDVFCCPKAAGRISKKET